MTGWCASRLASTLLALPLAMGLLLAPGGGRAQEEGWLASDRVDRVARAQLEASYAVTARALNLRGDPSVANEPVGAVVQEQMLLELERTFNTQENREWVRVRLPDGGEGWVAAAYLEPVADHLKKVEAAMTMLAELGAAGSVAALEQPGRKLETIHAGFVYSAPIGDAGWTFSHDVGRRALEKLPFVAATSYVESVPEDDELVKAAIEELIEGGANLIFTTSFGYMEPTLEAARRHPDIVFMHSGGYKTAPNVGTYFGRIYQARYLTGMVAGGATASGILGYVAAFPIPQVLRGINAFTLGAQSVNPDVQVRVVWTGTWYGPGIERETAERLVDFGADVLTMHQNSPATVQVAEQRGKFGIGYHSDMSLFAPTAHMTAAAWNWEPIYVETANALHEGRWQPDQLWWGLDQDAVRLAPLNKNLPDGLLNRVEDAKRAIAEKRLRVFEGPIRDQAGVVRVVSGKIPSEADILSMDYLVLGVKGEVPPPRTTGGIDN